MAQEDKELLLKDLCARLPYHPILNWKFIDNTSKDEELKELSDLYIWWITKAQDCEVKPYLRPMSSMTEEDNLSLSKHIGCSIRAKYGEIYFPIIEDNTLGNWEKICEWLNKHHFDYRGLIEKGLAIEVTEENNPYEGDV